MHSKIILVTGAERGLGKSIALYLAEKGYTVIANYKSSTDKALELEKIAKEQNYNLSTYKADVTNLKEVQEMFDFIIKKYHKIDVVINNAGVGRAKMLLEISSNDIDYIMNGNLYSVIYTSQIASKYMIKNQKGLIINISSIYGLNGEKGAILYSASKAAVDAATKSMAKELGEYNIRVNSVAPGVMQTDLNSSLSEEDWNNVQNSSPLHRITNTEDIAKCISWLINDESTTGQVISINAGTTIL